ncbi:MAG: hypothetical protein FWH17_04235 [Oscillospiraceae bacterium]|nr:hypothetical protein [Oscillospiraceae bacterium]
MFILIPIVFLAPALIAVLFYERFKGYELILRKRIELLIVFAFLIIAVAHAIFWARGWEFADWTLTGNSSLNTIAFIAQYMLITLVAAIVLAYVLSLVKVSGISRIGSSDDEADGEADGEDAADDAENTTSDDK